MKKIYNKYVSLLRDFFSAVCMCTSVKKSFHFFKVRRAVDFSLNKRNKKIEKRNCYREREREKKNFFNLVG